MKKGEKKRERERLDGELKCCGEVKVRIEEGRRGVGEALWLRLRV